MRRITHLMAALLILPLLLLGTTAWHGLLMPTPPNLAPEPMALNECLSACGNQLQSGLVGINQREEEKEKEPRPEPAEPYYLAFLGAGWTTLVFVAAQYLQKYLRWRPPDLYTINVSYRF